MTLRKAGLLSGFVVAPLVFVVLLLSLLTTSIKAKAQDPMAAKLPDGSVIYGVVPPLFGGEPLRDVTKHLPEISDLGANMLWISPIYPSEDHGMISYSVTDYQGIREDFGSLQDFAELVKQAHARGIKIMLDFVPNHTSAQHPFALDAEKNDPSSPYYSFYDRDVKGAITHYFDWNHLLNLNYQNEKVEGMVTDAFEYWVQAFDVDGFRVDAAWGVKERNADFWPQLIRRLASIKPGLIFLAEASAHDPYYLSNGFDLSYDWTTKLGEWAWQTAFDQPHEIGARLHDALTAGATSPSHIVRFINNNDTGARFITKHGLAKTRVAAVLQLTLPGIPIVYNGDEVGAEFSPYEDPAPLTWNDPHHLKVLYKKLISLRKTVPALSSDKWLPLLAKSGSGDTYSYLRLAHGNRVLVALNFGATDEVHLSLPKEIALSAGTVYLRDLLSGKSVPVKVASDHESVSFRLPTMSAVLLEM